jgi:ABC-type branched-subunit amino acid transport system ATPase component
MPDVLSVENLSAGYGPVKIIEDISLNVGEGEVVAVIGPNGAGKTTLMLAVMGMATVFSGRVLLMGDDVTRLPPTLRLGKAWSFHLRGDVSSPT